MPKYLIKGSYSHEGLQGMMAAGAASRQAAVETLAASVGGTVEALYFAFGADDVFAIADFPDDEAAAAVGLTVGASGAVSLETVKLLTVEQVDTAIGRTVEYRPPGT